jgi:hypothetical protein
MNLQEISRKTHYHIRWAGKANTVKRARNANGFSPHATSNPAE